MNKEFDLVVFGAAGFTGRLVVEYLMRSPSARRAALGHGRAQRRQARRGARRDRRTAGPRR